MRAYVFILSAFLAVACGGVRAQDKSTDQRFADILDHRSRGEFDAAIEALTVIIADSTTTDVVLRRAYNQLVWTIVAKSDDISERLRMSAMTGPADELRGELDDMARRLGAVVGAALTLFPDLRADDTIPDPSRVNQAYEPARQRMFGNLVVNSSPDSAAVWIYDPNAGWRRRGYTPLRRNLFPVGSYEIRLTREGHKDVEVTSNIGPSETTQHDVTLPRRRSRTWWLTRIGAPVAGAVGVLVYALTSGDDGSVAEPDPLPTPPDPPSQ